MGTAAKRRRKNNTSGVVADTEKVSLISRLPFELVAEILLYSTSPVDILSLSRTCKHFCATLVHNPVAAFIWKRVRAQTIPPVPDPTKLGFSEPQLANFIYGGGKCTVCDKSTNNMYTSFSARIRLCGNHECQSKHWDNRKFHPYGIPQHALGLPWIEWTDSERPSQNHFVISKVLRTMDGMSHRVVTMGTPVSVDLCYDRWQLLQAENEYNKASLLSTTLGEYNQRKQECMGRLQDWMNGCLELRRWKWDLRRLQGVVTTNNHAVVKGFSLDKGRDKDDVRNTPTIVQLLREKFIGFERITRDDLEILWPKIEADLTRLEDHRKIVGVEVSRLRRCLEMELLYRSLDHSKFDCFPSLPQFRKLPTLRAFYDSGLDVEKTGWRNEFVDILVKNDVKEWATKTVQAFSERLGYPEWPSTDTLLHPVHRSSTRFTCTRCSKSGPKATRNKSLTFREAAHHLCLVSEKGNEDQWSPKNFVADVKASAVITRFVTAVGIDVQEKITADLVAIARHIVCLSCSAPIVMDFNAMIQHSHRHDNMEFTILTDEELNNFSDYPVLPGVTAMLVKASEQAKAWRSEAYFGCKHCVPDPLTPRAAETSSERKAPRPKKKLKAFSFCGLRSHLKEKHKVLEVADEDVFVFDEHREELGFKG